MAEIALFHHAYGLTEGLRLLCARLEAAGHVVHAPDYYGGRTFTRIDEGILHAGTLGHDAIEDVAIREVRRHPSTTVTIGFSLGAFPAQLLAQEWRHIHGCVLVAGCSPPRKLAGDWRHDVRLSLHTADPDDWVPDSDLDPLVEHAPTRSCIGTRGVGICSLIPRHAITTPTLPTFSRNASSRGWLRKTRGRSPVEVPPARYAADAGAGPADDPHFTLSGISKGRGAPGPSAASVTHCATRRPLVSPS